MAQVDDSYEAYLKWKEKEYAYEEYEHDHRQAKREFEEQRQEAHDYHLHLLQHLHNIADYFGYFVERVAPQEEVSSQFYQEIEIITSESEYLHRRKQDQIDEKEEEADQEFRRQSQIFEDEMEKLRKEYYELEYNR